MVFLNTYIYKGGGGGEGRFKGDLDVGLVDFPWWIVVFFHVT